MNVALVASLKPLWNPLKGFTCVQISCFQLLNDWRYIDFQTGHLADLEQFKIDSLFAEYRQVKTDPTDFWQVTFILLSLSKTYGHEKQSKPFSFNKKFKNHAFSLAQVISNDSISGNQELGSPVNKQNSKVQSFISLCTMFF